MTTHDATFYVQLEPRWGSVHWQTKERPLQEVKAVAITQTRPAKPRAGTVMIKLTVRIPDGAFLPLRPEAIVVIPDGMAIVGAIEVIAEQPDDDQDYTE